jgi:hypothetical protein
VKRAPDTLFDNVARSDTSPKTNLESLYQFLNRRAGPPWDRVRSEAEKWYEAFPRAERNHLRTRFQEDDVHQHLPAWWELYTYNLFQRLDYAVKVHPQLSASTKRKKNPDFLVSRGSESIYVESATVFNGDDISDGQASVCDCVDRAQNPDFMVDLEIESAGTKRPKERHIIRPLEEWLAGLNWADARKDLEAGVLMDSPRWRWQHPLLHGWVLDYMSIPVQPDSRGIPGRRIGIPPTPAAVFIHDVGKIRDKLEDKGSKYSSLKRPLDEPLIVALQFWNSVDEFEFRNALFGDVRLTWLENDVAGTLRTVRIPDGYWGPGSDPQGSRISAVLFGNTLRESNFASNLPELWINPWATNPLPQLEPFATVAIDDDRNFVRKDASRTARYLQPATGVAQQ